MPPPPNTKPENVLKRAQELIGVGQPQAALTILHEHVTSKRTRNSPIASLEPVMLLFVELCVDLRKGKMAKDGLYNYKNTSQNTNVATIELVFRKFIELAEQKVSEAQKKAEEVAGTATEGSSSSDTENIVNVGDLEATETPESIILSTVSGEQSKDRTDRAIVTPWLKFLWETYRTVLDIFKNNARLELMYQTTAHQAFQFCLKFARKTEFRRLCELLRNHLTNAAKYSSQMHAINLSDPDTLQRHLDTRFQQLNVAVELELWQEAFKSVEDTHTLLTLSKRPAKNSMMANSCEKLTRIFLRSENYLFHAAAWSRYYNLLSRSAALVNAGHLNKKDNPTNITEQDLTQAASFVVLSALAIPVISTSRSRGALVDVDETKKTTKNTRLTNLLFMSQAPTRTILFKDALSKDLLRRVRPEIRQLYNILEVDFHPLSICKRISPILAQIGADPMMANYVQPLQQVILTRLFQQLSQVYETVQLDFVLELAQFPEPFQMTRSTVEKFIMNGCKKGDLSIRVDHTTGILTFDSDVFASSKPLLPAGAGASANSDATSVQRLQSTPAEIVRSQLTRLAKALYITCQYVDPTFNEDRRKGLEAAYKRAEAGAAKEHLETLARREIIQKKKENAASAQAAREREEATAKRIKARKLQEAEVQRLADEQKDREMKRLKAEQQRVQREEMEKQLQELKKGVKGVDIDNLDLDDLDSGRIRAMKLAALEKEKNDLGEKLRIVAKRFDHLERAYRKEEIKLLPEDEKRQAEAEKAAYEKKKAETIANAERSHKEAVELKRRLGRLVSPFDAFRSQITEQRASEFEKRRKEAEQELNNKIEQRRREHRERLLNERRQREEDERRRVEEEQRAREEAEQREREERERKERSEAERLERAKQREEAAAAAKLQREREEEAERRRAERKMGGSAPIPVRAAAPTPSASGPPQIAIAGNKPSWREREAAKAAAAAAGGSPVPTAAAPVADAAPASRPGSYVPPTRRAGPGAAAGDAPPAPSGGAGRWQRSERPEPSAERPGSEKWQSRSRQGADGERPPLRSADSGSRGPLPPTNPPSSGAYRPGMLSGRKWEDKPAQ